MHSGSGDMSDNEEDVLRCAHCKSSELDVLHPEELEEGDMVECEDCGEESFLWCGQLVDENEYDESVAESACAARDEGRAHGGGDDWSSPESFRHEF